MSRRKNALIPLALFPVLLLACNLPLAISPASGTAPTPVTGPGQDTPTAMPAAPAQPSASPTADNSVVISVQTGSLNVRRGPSIYYDALAFLDTGQSATASARDARGGWLYIPLPDDPTASGWVSAGTGVSSVHGDVNSLPVKNVDPPMPAIIRNCTFHPMMIRPGDVLLQPQTDISGRSAHFPPGTYSAYDQNVSNKKVMTIDLKEGLSVDIKVNGTGMTYSCP